MFNCNFCNKDFVSKRSRANHVRYCDYNENKISCQKSTDKRNNQWTKARKEGKEYLLSESTLDKMSNSSKGKTRSEAFKINLSNKAKERGLGGHTSKNKIYYSKPNGEVIFLQSSYEVKLAKILDENFIEWSRPAPFLWKDTDGIVHRYYPDFKVNNTYFDTKNDFLIKRDKLKIETVIKQNKIKLIVLGKEDINIDNIMLHWPSG